MERARGSSLSSILLCGGVAAQLLGCGEAAGGAAPPPAPDDDGGLEVTGSGEADPLDPAGCLTRTAGAGFASVPLDPAHTLSVVDFDATVSAAALDAVIGLSHGPATSFARLATAARFAPSGVIDALDRLDYRADRALSFQPGRTYRIRLVTDLPSHTYSVYVADASTVDPAVDAVRVARRYAFRASQAHAASLDALSAIVDGPTGQLTICDLVDVAPSDVVYSREGSYAVAPLTDDQALVSDGVATTWKLGAAGQVLGQIARGGEVAADLAGDVYVALAHDGQLAIHAFTAQLAPRWSRVDPVEPFADVQAIAADATGVSVALATAAGLSSIRRYPAGGGDGGVIHGAGTRAALARDGFAVATTSIGGVTVSMYDRDGTWRWTRTFANDVTVEVMTLGLDDSVVLGGHFFEPINFGGPTLEPATGSEVDVDSYAVALARADGAHVFTDRIPTTRLTGAGANAGRLVIAGEDWVTPIFPHLWQLDPAGNLLAGEPETGFYEQWGRSGRIAVGPSNRIYWERAMVWPAPFSPAFPYLLAIAP